MSKVNLFVGMLLRCTYTNETVKIKEIKNFRVYTTNECSFDIESLQKAIQNKTVEVID